MEKVTGRAEPLFPFNYNNKLGVTFTLIRNARLVCLDPSSISIKKATRGDRTFSTYDYLGTVADTPLDDETFNKLYIQRKQEFEGLVKTLNDEATVESSLNRPSI